MDLRKLRHSAGVVDAKSRGKAAASFHVAAALTRASDRLNKILTQFKQFNKARVECSPVFKKAIGTGGREAGRRLNNRAENSHPTHNSTT